MPSVRTLLAGFLATTLFQASIASPIPAEAASDCGPVKTGATPTIPNSGSTPDLPTTNLTLAYVAIGRGIQNYSCTAVGASPSAIGAVATLFDATSLAYINEAALHAIPPIAVNMPLPPANFAIAGNILKPLGHHYFLADGTPTFNLTAANKILYAKKNQAVNAPASASKGPMGTGAVAWLWLEKKPAYTSVGASEVYRVETAGGNQTASCTAAGVYTVPYAAEYWFYN